MRAPDLLRDLLQLLGQRSEGETLAIMSETGLTLPQIVALHTLRIRGAHNVSGIADALRLSRAATSHLVDRLVRAKLVRRSEDPEDRRQKRVEITRDGAELLDRLEASRSAELERAFGYLTPSLRAELERVLGAVVRELAERVPARPRSRSAV